MYSSQFLFTVLSVNSISRINFLVDTGRKVKKKKRKDLEGLLSEMHLYGISPSRTSLVLFSGPAPQSFVPDRWASQRVSLQVEERDLGINQYLPGEMAHVNGPGETMAAFLVSFILEPFIIQAQYSCTTDPLGKLCTGLPHVESIKGQWQHRFHSCVHYSSSDR